MSVMAYTGEITIVVSGNSARIEPVDAVHHILADQAVCVRRLPVITGRGGRSRFRFEEEKLYAIKEDAASGQEYLYTYAGLVPRLASRMQAEGLRVRMSTYPTGLPDHQPDFTWAKEQKIQLRSGQLRMLEAILKYERAQLVGVTAMGKTFLIRLLAHCYPQPTCRLVIATPSRGLLHAYLDELRPDFPMGEVGQLGGGRKDVRSRIIVSTFDSLEHAPSERTNLLLVDEAHECGTANRLEILSRFNSSRAYGFTASANCRSDGADLAVEAIFGGVQVRVGYQEARQEGYVPNVDAYFYRCETPQSGLQNPTYRRRRLVWRNQIRNETIAGVCRYWDRKLTEQDGTEPQILVLVATLEHMFALARLLPDYTCLLDDMSPKLKQNLVREGLIQPNWRAPGLTKKLELTQQFAAGSLRKAIGQIRMGTGTDTKRLDVLVRADGQSSEVGNIQYRGRVMRGERGIYADILDVGDSQLASAARARLRSARRYGMSPKEVDLWDNHRILE